MWVFAGTAITLMAVLVWVLLEVHRMAREAQQTLTAVRGHMLLLIEEVRETTEQADGLLREVREAFQSTSTLWYVLGDLGESVHRAQTFVQERGAWLTRILGSFVKKTNAGARRQSTNGNGREYHYEAQDIQNKEELR